MPASLARLERAVERANRELGKAERAHYEQASRRANTEDAGASEEDAAQEATRTAAVFGHADAAQTEQGDA